MNSLINILSNTIKEGIDEDQNHNKKFIFNYLDEKTKNLEKIDNRKLEGYFDTKSGFFLLGYLGDFFMDSWTYHDIDDNVTYSFPIVDWLMDKFGRNKGEIIIDYATGEYEQQIKSVFKYKSKYLNGIRFILNDTDVYELNKETSNIIFFSKDKKCLLNIVNDNRIVYYPDLLNELRELFHITSRRNLVTESFEYLIKSELMKLFNIDLGSKVSVLGSFNYDYVIENGKYLGEGEDILPKK